MAELPDVVRARGSGARSGFSSSGRVWATTPAHGTCTVRRRSSRKRLRRGISPHARRSFCALPGVGDYTASAIRLHRLRCRPEPAVDGNRPARRRPGHGGIAELDIHGRAGCAARSRAMAHRRRSSRERPGEWNQAMMDLGATVCTAERRAAVRRLPRPRLLPRRTKTGMTDVLPVRAAKKPRTGRGADCVPARAGRQRSPLRKRPAKGLLAGLWELPNVPGNLDEAGAAITLAQWGLTARTLTPVGAAKHIFSHVEWDMHGYLAAAEGENNEFLWADGAALQAAAIPSAFRYYFDTAVRWLAAQQGGTDHGTALL